MSETTKDTMMVMGDSSSTPTCASSNCGVRKPSNPLKNARKPHIPKRFIVTELPDDEPAFYESPIITTSKNRKKLDDKDDGQITPSAVTKKRPSKTEVKGRFTIIDLSPDSPPSGPVVEAEPDSSLCPAPPPSLAITPRHEMRMERRPSEDNRSFVSRSSDDSRLSFVESNSPIKIDLERNGTGNGTGTMADIGTSGDTCNGLKNNKPPRMYPTDPSGQIDRQLEALQKDSFEMKQMLEDMVVRNATWIDTLLNQSIHQRIIEVPVNEMWQEKYFGLEQAYLDLEDKYKSLLRKNQTLQEDNMILEARLDQEMYANEGLRSQLDQLTQYTESLIVESEQMNELELRASDITSVQETRSASQSSADLDSTSADFGEVKSEESALTPQEDKILDDQEIIEEKENNNDDIESGTADQTQEDCFAGVDCPEEDEGDVRSDTTSEASPCKSEPSVDATRRSLPERMTFIDTSNQKSLKAFQRSKSIDEATVSSSPSTSPRVKPQSTGCTSSILDEMLQNHANKLAADLHQHREDTTISFDFEKRCQLANNQDPNISFNPNRAKSLQPTNFVADSPPQRMVFGGKDKGVIELQSNNQLNHSFSTTHTTVGSIKGSYSSTTTTTSTPTFNNHQGYPVQHSFAFSNHRSIHTVANQKTNYEFGIQLPSPRPSYQASVSSPLGITTPGRTAFFPSMMYCRQQVFTTTGTPQSPHLPLQQQPMHVSQHTVGYQNGNVSVGPSGGAYSSMMQYGVTTHGRGAGPGTINNGLGTSGPIPFPNRSQSTGIHYR